MKTPFGKARGEGNCAGAIQDGEPDEQGLLSLKTLWASLARLR
jgi:hypothetical protein